MMISGTLQLNSSLTFSPNTSRKHDRLIEERVERALVTYVLPVIIFIGIVGNSLSVAVLLRTRMRRTSVYFYLTVLACADTAVLLLSGFKTWIRLVSGFEFLHLSDSVCRSTMLALAFALHFSAWLLVLVTGDRFVAVWFPFRAAVLCSARRARYAVMVLSFVIILYHSHMIWTIQLKYPEDDMVISSENKYSTHNVSLNHSERNRDETTEKFQDFGISGNSVLHNTTKLSQPQHGSSISAIKHRNEGPKCAGRSDLQFMKEPFEFLKLVTYSVLPFMMILITNILIAVKLHWNAPIRKNLIASSKVRRRTLSDARDCGAALHRVSVGGESEATTVTTWRTRASPSADQSTLGRQARVTYMLLSVSIAYLLLSGPFTLNLILSHHQSPDRLTRARNQLLRTFCFLLMYCNHAVNFFLYCMTGRKFRQELMEMFSGLVLWCRRSGDRRAFPPTSLKALPLHLQDTEMQETTLPQGIASSGERLNKDVGF